MMASKIEPALRVRIEAEDVLQQAYIVAFRAIRRPEADEADDGGRSVVERSVDAHQPTDKTYPNFDSVEHFVSWLEQIALHRLQDMQRAARRQKRDAGRELAAHTDLTGSYPDLVQRLAADDATPSRMFARDEAIALMMSCLARLTDDQREVVRMRFIEDVDVEDIARRLERSPDAIYMLCHRGLRALREHMRFITRFMTGE